MVTDSRVMVTNKEYKKYPNIETATINKLRLSLDNLFNNDYARTPIRYYK